MSIRVGNSTLLWWCLVCVFLQANTWAQNSICIDSSEAPDYLIQNYQSEDGLCQNTVKDLALDRAGFLWITTENGLNRFDGGKFIKYQGAEYGNIGQRFSNIFKYRDTLVFQSYPHLYVREGILHKLGSGKSHTAEIYAGPISKRDFEAIFDTTGLLFTMDFRSSNPQTHYFRAVHGRGPNIEFFENSVKSGEIAGTSYGQIGHNYILKDGLLTVLHEGEIRRYRGTALEDQFDVDFLGKEATIFQHPDNEEVFIYSNKLESLFLWTNTEGQPCLKRVLKMSGTGITASCIQFLDTTDHFFLGTLHHGLFELRKHGFRNIYDPAAGASNATYLTTSIGRDSFLVENSAILDDGNIYKPDLRDTASLVDIWRKAEGPFSVNYLNLYGVLFFNPFEYGSGEVFKHPWFAGGSSSPVADGDSTIWVFSEDSVYRWNNVKWVASPLHIPKVVYGTIHYDKWKDLIWISTDGGVFKWIPGDTVATKVAPYSGESHWKILSVSEEHTLFLSWNTGIEVLHKGEMHTIPKDPLLYMDFAHCMVEDNNGFLWISSNNGIFKVLISDVLKCCDDRDQQVYYEYYDKSWGMLANEFNGRGYPCGALLQDGRIVFPSFMGIAAFDPDELAATVHGSKLVVDQLVIDANDTLLPDLLNLEQNYQELSIKVGHAQYGHSNNRYMQYMLNGYHDHWIDFPDDGLLSFQRLPYGDYSLQIRKLTGHGAESRIALDIPIHIKKLYFQTLWFKVLVVLSVLLLFFVILILRNRMAVQKQAEMEKLIEQKTEDYKLLNEELKLNLAKLRQTEKEQRQNIRLKEKMMAIYTHDIRGPLRFIMNMARNSSIALDKLEKKDIDYYLNTIESATDGIFKRTEQMFTLSNIANDELEFRMKFTKLYGAVTECIEEHFSMASEKNVRLINRINRDFVIRSEPNALRIIITNLLQNAIKFTQNGSVKFESYSIPEFDVLTVSDTGMGINAAELKTIKEGTYKSKKGTGNEMGKGFGLKVVNDFLRRMGGYMEIDSKPGQGTIVSLFFKRMVDHSTTPNS